VIISYPSVSVFIKIETSSLSGSLASGTVKRKFTLLFRKPKKGVFAGIFWQFPEQ
jgi:hypothetical protein